MTPASFKNDPTRVGHVIILAIFSFFAVVAVILRLWARRIKRTVWESSDYLIIPGLIFALGLSTFTIHSYVYGELGEDVAQTGNPQRIQKFVVLQMKSLIVGPIIWAVSVFFIRASILALYISIFQIPTFRMAGYVIHGINAAFFVSTVLAVCLICRPLAFSWNQQIPGGTCGDQKSLDVYIGVFNLLLDVTVVLLPMPVLWGLQMASSKKVILSGMFGLGVIICVLTLIRARISAENHGSNAQKIYGIIALFTDLEALIGVINACLPVMKPIFVKLHSSKASSWFNSVMSGSILIFVRPSQLGSAWKSRPTTKRHSTHKHPTPKEMAPWPLDDKDYDAQIEVQESPPPRYADKRPTKMMSAYSPIKSPPVKSPTPPVPPKGRSYSPAKRLAPAEEQDRGGALGIYVERSWDVERGERGESAHSDREELVQYPQRLW